MVMVERGKRFVKRVLEKAEAMVDWISDVRRQCDP